MSETMKYAPQVKLDEERQRKLLLVRSNMGYEVMQEIGEQLCVIRETRLLQMDHSADATGEQILAAHNQARACRAFFTEWQLEVEANSNLFLQQQKESAPEMPGAPEGSEDGESIS